ncbi:ABC transporter substrate-binding protein [Sphingomonas hankookensis]|uniref:ABC transporter substrate-binding protein n=1 Tax=Sphingomonas hankookensis TaxID=563996 RepID=UPI001F585B01|nr:ABC transporter substrate-binding protein [Sphingomonas hankookensis]
MAALAIGLAVAGCDALPPQPSRVAITGGREIAMPHARTFRVVARDGYRVVDLKASVVGWGGTAIGEEQFQRLVLVPRGVPAPALTSDLAGARLIRTPVTRLASNAVFHEAITKVLGVNDRLVAVGGTKSWDDALRARVRAGAVRQIGYGWHSPPQLDALVAAQPEVLLMTMGDMRSVGAKPRIESLGIAVVPIFLDNEADYMGRVDYVRLIGMLVGREAQADAFAAMVARNIAALKTAAAAQPTRSVLSAWFAGADRWNPTVRNADAQLLRDANGRNLFAEPDDPARDSFPGGDDRTADRQGARCRLLDPARHPFRALHRPVRPAPLPRLSRRLPVRCRWDDQARFRCLRPVRDSRDPPRPDPGRPGPHAASPPARPAVSLHSP